MAHRVKASEFDITLCGVTIKKHAIAYHVTKCKTCQDILKKASEKESE